jgi:hypothetical protein
VPDVLAVLGGSSLLLGVCLLACPLMMVLMMRGMRGGSGGSQQLHDSPAPDPEKQAELARLRAEINQLKAADRDRDERSSSQNW